MEIAMPLVVNLAWNKGMKHTNQALKKFFITTKSTQKCCPALGGDVVLELATILLLPLLFEIQEFDNQPAATDYLHS